MINDETALAETQPTEPVTTEAPSTEAPSDPPSAGGESEDPLFEALSSEYDKLTAPEEAPESAAPESETELDGKEPSDTAGQPDEEGDKPEQDGHPAPVIDAPQSWSADYKAKFATLPPDVQTYVAERERQAHEQISRQGEQLAVLKPVQSALQQFPRYQNDDTGQMLAGLIGWQAMFDANPVEALQKVADHYKLDLRQVAGVTETAQDDDYDFLKDPRVDQVSQELNQTRQELQKAMSEIQRLTGHVSQQEQAKQQARSQEIVSTIETFKKDAAYFAELEDDIVQEVTFLRSKEPTAPDADILKRAYERAVNLNSTVRAKIEQDAKAKEAEEAAKKAEKAKRQASVNVKAKTSSARRSDSRWDDDEALSKLYDQVATAS